MDFCQDFCTAKYQIPVKVVLEYNNNNNNNNNSNNNVLPNLFGKLQISRTGAAFVC